MTKDVIDAARDPGAGLYSAKWLPPMKCSLIIYCKPTSSIQIRTKVIKRKILFLSLMISAAISVAQYRHCEKQQCLLSIQCVSTVLKGVSIRYVTAYITEYSWAMWTWCHMGNMNIKCGYSPHQLPCFKASVLMLLAPATLFSWKEKRPYLDRRMEYNVMN